MTSNTEDKTAVRTAYPLLNSLNSHITCSRCKGYLIDATTLTGCLHTFCRSCIIRYLESNSRCPICDVTVVPPGHTSVPPDAIRSDKILQALVYKMVPGLYADEIKRRKLFAEYHANDGHSGRSVLPRSRISSGRTRRRVIISGEEEVSVRLQGQGVEDRFFLCPAAVTIRALRSFIITKFNLSSNIHEVLMTTVDEELLDNEQRLLDVAYITKWNQVEPLCIKYFIITTVSRSAKKSSVPEVSESVVDNPCTSESKSAGSVSQTSDGNSSINGPNNMEAKQGTTSSGCEQGKQNCDAQGDNSDTDKGKSATLNSDGVITHPPNLSCEEVVDRNSNKLITSPEKAINGTRVEDQLQLENGKSDCGKSSGESLTVSPLKTIKLEAVESVCKHCGKESPPPQICCSGPISISASITLTINRQENSLVTSTDSEANKPVKRKHRSLETIIDSLKPKTATSSQSRTMENSSTLAPMYSNSVTSSCHSVMSAMSLYSDSICSISESSFCDSTKLSNNFSYNTQMLLAGALGNGRPNVNKRKLGAGVECVQAQNGGKASAVVPPIKRLKQMAGENYCSNPVIQTTQQKSSFSENRAKTNGKKFLGIAEECKISEGKSVNLGNSLTPGISVPQRCSNPQLKWPYKNTSLSVSQVNSNSLSNVKCSSFTRAPAVSTLGVGSVLSSQYSSTTASFVSNSMATVQARRLQVQHQLHQLQLLHHHQQQLQQQRLNQAGKTAAASSNIRSQLRSEHPVAGSRATSQTQHPQGLHSAWSAIPGYPRAGQPVLPPARRANGYDEPMELTTKPSRDRKEAVTQSKDSYATLTTLLKR